MRHRRKSLPELAQIAELDTEIAALDHKRIEASTRVSDLEREQKKADQEVELVKARRRRNEERLNSGAVANPKDLESLQHEIVALDRRIATLEDAELEIMESLEEASAALDAVADDLQARRREREQLVARRDEAYASIDAELAEVEAARGAIARSLPDDLVALYEKVRSAHGGLGAAALRARRCEGCRLELNGADLRELAQAPDDEVQRCPECSRILVRTSESGL
ncbi:zinc ribbon domain-containing protein [uncultured Aeromicrobium sp.]|uniref:zinc ribbon domain-containing protein n=1 Tax=uncultured Aeromicrobium sp. TaxID=337820 RepID=UPI0025F89BF5|nr:C4-type zinc ribbon domain-containing protein [uncultured Aeromicrobium sp.]